MNRVPPKAVIMQLRQEVGFGCPVLGCGNPYLEWHHFDPPWREQEHHNPDGMIALCTHHHKKADGGAYTKEQLQEMKHNVVNAELVRGQFDWLRNDLLAVVGGILYHETLNILRVDGRDVIFFRRDEEGYLRLNIHMLSLLPQERAVIEDNIWTNIGSPKDLISPPQGKELRIDYENGDYLAVKFFELKTPEQGYEKYNNDAFLHAKAIKFPITVVEIAYRIGGSGIDLSPTGTNINASRITGGFISHCGVGLSVNNGLTFRENPSLLPYIPVSRLELCPCGSGLRYKHCHGWLGDTAI